MSYEDNIHLLLEHGADASYRTTTDIRLGITVTWSALHCALQNSLSARTVSMLLAAGADPNAMIVVNCNAAKPMFQGREDEFRQANLHGGTAIASWIKNEPKNEGDIRVLVELLRGGATLDNVVPNYSHAEEYLLEVSRHPPPGLPLALMRNVRAAGGTWRQYVYGPVHAMLLLRALRASGGAEVGPATSSYVAFALSPDLEDGVVGKILSYWMPKQPFA